MKTAKEKNFVSGVVYFHNGEKQAFSFLEKVNNILRENFEKYEIICVNDCSTDKTEEEINNFCKQNQTESLTVVNTGFFQGLESGMVAGVDIAIGDFVFEFDRGTADFPDELVMEIYRTSLEGNDIVFACPQKRAKFTSKIFYTLFNAFSKMKYKLKTQDISIISRRGINRVKSMGVKTVYRKAVYASCGLNVSEIFYTPKSDIPPADTQRELKTDLASNSLILFTDIAYKISATLSIIMALVLLAAGVYTVAVFLSANPVAGWTTTMLVISFGFFGLFIMLAFVMKYLSVILNLIFTHKQYTIESIKKIK